MRVLRLFSLFAALSVASCNAGDASKPSSTTPTSSTLPTSKAPRLVKFDAETLARLGVRVEAAGTTGDAGGHRLVFPGSLDYALDRYAEVGSIVEGRVSSVHVNVGDNVKRGQRLARVAVPALVDAQAQLSVAEASAKIADAHAAREASLLERSLTTAREAELARGESAKVQAEARAARSRLALLGNAPGSVVEDGNAMSLTAPLDGTVVRRDIVLGGRLQPTQTAFVVADLSTVWATVDVFETDLRHIVPGNTVQLQVDAWPQRSFEGRVAVVEPHVAQSTRTAKARIVVENRDGALKPGQFFRASVAIRVEGKEMLVPRGAVQPLGAEEVVFIEQSAGVFEIRPVKRGRTMPQLVEVLEGVAAGEKIVVESASLLRAEASKQ